MNILYLGSYFCYYVLMVNCVVLMPCFGCVEYSSAVSGSEDSTDKLMYKVGVAGSGM